MNDNSLLDEIPAKPGNLPAWQYIISRIFRIGSAVLLIIGGNVDLILGFLIFGLTGLNDAFNFEAKQQGMRIGMAIFVAGITFFGLNLTIGVSWILKKRWAFWMGLVMSITHSIGMFTLSRILFEDDFYSSIFRIISIGWGVTFVLFLISTISLGIGSARRVSH